MWCRNGSLASTELPCPKRQKDNATLDSTLVRGLEVGRANFLHELPMHFAQQASRWEGKMLHSEAQHRTHGHIARVPRIAICGLPVPTSGATATAIATTTASTKATAIATATTYYLAQRLLLLLLLLHRA